MNETAPLRRVLLTGKEVRQFRTYMGWSVRAFAKLCDRSEPSVRAWEAGRRNCPPDVCGWLAGMWDWMEANPPPVSRRKGGRGLSR